VIADSYLPGAERHNIENIGLEPVWPYGIIGPDSPLLPLALRTYARRPNKSAVDWSYDPIQAARLGLGSEVAATLIATTEKFQGFANGMAKWEPAAREFYVEQAGVVAEALQEALVQDEDGVIRVARAIPPGWDFEGSVYARGNTKVDVQTRHGVVTGVVVEAGIKQSLKIGNPWPGKAVDVVSATSRRTIISGATDPVIQIPCFAGVSYIVERWGAHELPIRVSGRPATAAKRLGGVQIGLFPK